MKNLWLRLLADETGVILSSEIALIGTVGVLGMVVGLESVTSAVTNELNDLASAFGALDQSYNYRSIRKLGHARVSGSGFNDGRDFCDCELIVQSDVSGQFGQGFSQTNGISQSAVSQSAIVSAPVVREQIIKERVIEEVVEPVIVNAVAPVCPDDEIIEEHIIRRRVRSDCSTKLSSDCAATSLKYGSTSGRSTKSIQEPKLVPEKVETKKSKK